MVYPNALQILALSQKTHQLHDQHDHSSFFYEKPSFRSIGHLSPTSTCPSDQNITLWESQHEQRSVINDKHQENLTTVEFGTIQGNVVAISIQKFSLTVSEYLKHALNMKTEQILDFISLDELKSLDIQKQQYEELLDDYSKSAKSTHQNDQILKSQNSVFKAFLEEITYLNYQEINFQIIQIFLQMFSFKNRETICKNKTNEFLQDLASSSNLKYISLKFLNQEGSEMKNQAYFLNFLEKLFEIFENLYIHYTILQPASEDEERESSILKGGLKLFSSKRDIWDSDDEDECACLCVPSKRIKYV